MTIHDLNGIQIEVLEGKLELAKLERKSIETNEKFSGDDLNKHLNLVAKIILKSRELKNDFESTVVNLHNYQIKQKIKDVLLDFNLSDIEFRNSFKVQAKKTFDDHYYNWIIAHMEKNTDKMNYLTLEMNKIKEFLEK